MCVPMSRRRRMTTGTQKRSPRRRPGRRCASLRSSPTRSSTGRSCNRLVGQRTSLMNQMRSILLERGIVVPQGRRSLLDALAAVSVEGDAGGLGAAHDAGYGLRAHPLVEPGLDEAAQVRQRPGTGLAVVRVRPAQDMVDQHGLLGLAQPLRPASDGRAAAFETLGVYVPGSDGRNVKDLELLAGDEGPTGQFRPLGTFTVANGKVKDGWQEFRLPPTTAKFLKVRVVSRQDEASNDTYLYELRLLGALK